MKAIAHRVGGDIYNVIYHDSLVMDCSVPFSYLEMLVKQGYTVLVEQRVYRGEGELEKYTLSSDNVKEP